VSLLRAGIFDVPKDLPALLQLVVAIAAFCWLREKTTSGLP
jgi:hypothetical protein